MNRYLYLDLEYGLCNRLWCILSFYAIARRVNRRLLIHWPANRHVSFASFEDVFQTKLQFITDSEMKNIRADDLNTTSYNLPIAVRKSLRSMEIINNIPFYTKKNIVFPTSCYFVPDYFAPTAWFNLLLFLSRELFFPKDGIKKQIDQFCQANQVNPYNSRIAGLHIRRTDHPASKTISSDEKVVELLNQVKQKFDRVYLACDCPLTKEKIERQFGDVIFSFPITYGSNGLRKTSLVDSCIELYILSQCSIVLGSFGSSYSKYASMMRDINEFVVGKDILNDFNFNRTFVDAASSFHLSH